MTPSNERHGVIFDMDGVLVDSSEAHFVAWKRLGEIHGKAFPRKLFEQTFGMHNLQIIPAWLDDDTGLEEVKRLSDLKESLYREAAARSVEALPGVARLIHDLAAGGFLLAVGSSGPRENVELILDLLGVRSSFSALSTGDEVENGKPHPEVFLKAASRLELSPASCVVIEDAPQGIEAGRAAGARVVAVTSTRPATELRHADLVVDSLEALNSDRLEALILNG